MPELQLVIGARGDDSLVAEVRLYPAHGSLVSELLVATESAAVHPRLHIELVHLAIVVACQR